MLSNNNGGSRGFSFGCGSDDEEDEDDDDTQGLNGKIGNIVDEDEVKMGKILDEKKQEVITALIDMLGARNKDFEMCLNASMVLIEMSDCDNMYGKLVESQNITKIINNSCDIKNPN